MSSLGHGGEQMAAGLRAQQGQCPLFYQSHLLPGKAGHGQKDLTESQQMSHPRPQGRKMDLQRMNGDDIIS